MNEDAKILKVLENQIQKCIKKDSNTSWSKFTPGTKGWFTIPKSINKIHNINRRKKIHLFQ